MGVEATGGGDDARAVDAEGRAARTARGSTRLAKEVPSRGVPGVSGEVARSRGRGRGVRERGTARAPPADDERRQRSTARGEGDDGRGSARAGDGRGARARADAAGPALRGAASDEGDVPSEQHRASARRPGCGEGVVGGGDKKRRIRAGARRRR